MTLILLLSFAALALASFVGGSYLKIMDQAALTSGGPTSTTPVFVGKPGVGSERLREGRPVLAEIDRDGIDGALIQGTIGLWGANIHNVFTGPLSACQKFRGGDGATGGTVFQCVEIPYAAQSNYNNIVIKNGTPMTAGAGAGKFTVSNVGGFLCVTLGTAAVGDDVIEVHRVTPVAMVADAENSIVRNEVVGKQLVWALGTHDGSSSDLSRTIVALRALN
jgi:hypothetical protein